MSNRSYIIGDEAWYAPANRIFGDKPYLSILSSDGDPNYDGINWEFTVTFHDFGDMGSGVRLDMFQDSWVAFTEVPEFFAALTELGDDASSLADVVAICDRLGYGDVTKRVSPFDEVSR